MHRIKLSILLAASLGFVAPLAGCGGQRGAPHDEKAEGGPGGPASAAKVLTMADVDDSFSDKIKGERFQITYDSTDPFHGAEEPLVTIVEFSDFQCPYCQKFTDNLKELLDDPAYKDDVRVVFKQFPLDMHKDARAAAEAALAAGAQGKFWEMHDILFNPKNRSKMSRADLEGYAADLGLDVGAFTKALDSGAFKAKVDADLEQGKKFGVRGTPSFVINGKFQRGAPRTIEGLKQLVDAEKKDAEELIKAGIPRGELYARMMKAAKDSRTPPPQQPRQQAGAPDPNANYAVPTEGRPSWGKPDALVTIVEFSDFQCPFCSRVNPAMKQIKETYPNDVRIVFRQLPLPMHKQAQPAARAALAADRQGKFWEMHDKLFENQKAFSDESFKAWATELGMDAGKFEKDYNDPVIAKMIADDMTVSSKFGARGTPAFFVNGRFINGARPFEQFDALIKEEKAKAEKFMKEKGVPAAKVYDEMLKGWETELKQPPIADHQRRDVATAGLPVKGNAKSPKVTIVECSDFDCPYCQRATDTVKQIMDKYGNEVAFYFRHFPLPMHKNAEPAHRAAIAAQKQGDDKFWAMHDKLFADRKSRDDESLKAVATELGLNVAKWEQDFKDPATAQRVKDDMAACGKLGVRGAPGFFINGRLLSGARPFPQFEAVIKEELAGGFEKAAAAKPDGK